MKVPARELIIDSAAKRFAEFGIDRVSLDEIAVAASVHRSTLHRHFPEGRDALVIAALDRQAMRASVELLEVMNAAADARTGLISGLTYLVMQSRQNHVLRLLFAQDATKEAMLNSASTYFRTRAAEIWEQVAERARAEQFTVTQAGAESVVAHILRVGLSLVNDPGELVSADAVRNYVETFVVPALVVR